MAKKPMLWTAARLIAALSLMAAGAAIVAYMITLYPDERWDRDQRELTYLFVAVGWFVGWFGLGQKAHSEPNASSVGLGLRAVITMCAYILGLLSIWYGIQKMKVHAYHEPVPAVLDMFEQLTEYFFFLVHPKLLAAIAFVGLVAGSLTKGAARKWN